MKSKKITECVKMRGGFKKENITKNQSLLF